MNRIKNRILSFILAIAFIFGSAGVSFADGNAVSEFLYNDPFEYMVSLTDEEIPNSSDSTDVMSVGAENSAESVDERLARRHRERIEKAQKTDRYIVKYKSDAHKTSVENKLHGRLSSTHEIIGENENRTKKTKVIVLNEAIKPQDFANELRNMDIGNSIEYIQPDFELSPQEISLEITEVNGIESISDAEMGTVPMATNPVTVAVIDTGADLSHPLFANYLWEDESGNNGWNFVDENGILYDAEASPSYAHGTHVTGIIVQAARESATPVKVMTCRAFDNGSAYTSDVIEAIEYAQDNGAKIINMSFGGTHYNPALEEAMEETNALFITAAGNHRMDLSTTPVYPACFNLDNIICVASANADKGFTYFSNFSTAHVDIAALGREVTSAYPNRTVYTSTQTKR